MTATVLGCLVLPGLGWALRLRLRDPGDTLALTVVLSLCLTAIVATAQVVAGWWSPVGGLLALGGIAVLGFVPGLTVVERTGTFLFGPTGLRGDQDLDTADVEWKDWYADALRRSDEEHRLRQAEAKAAEREWRDWYADAVRGSDEEHRRRLAEAEAAEQEWRNWFDASPASDAQDVGGRAAGSQEAGGQDAGDREADLRDRERTSSTRGKS